jgi:transcriptional regulator with XRE-family HTH domain
LRLREETGLTQSALARKGRLSSQQISDWERGAKKPAESSQRRLAALFGVDFVWLAFGLGERDGSSLRSA